MYKSRFLFIALWFLIFGFAKAQNQLQGVVVDALSGKTIPFAFAHSTSQKALVTDPNGRFEWALDMLPNQLVWEAVGYAPLVVDVPNHDFWKIELTPLETRSTDIQRAKEYGAVLHNKMLLKKNANDPMQFGVDFSYRITEKGVLTAHPDSIPVRISLVNASKKQKKIDATFQQLRLLLQNQHLFVYDKYAQFFVRNGKSKEYVQAVNMSGLQEPIYELIGMQLHSFSVYDPTYVLFETHYRSPFSRKGDALFDFYYLKSFEQDGKEFQLLAFIPKNNVLQQLSGVLTLEANTAAICGLDLHLNGLVKLKLHMSFQEVESLGWFPYISTLKLTKGDNHDPIRILGEAIYFGGTYNEAGIIRDKHPSDYIYLHLSRIINDVLVHEKNNYKRPRITVELPESALNKSEIYWQTVFEQGRKSLLNERQLLEKDPDLYTFYFRDERNTPTHVGLDTLLRQKNIEKRLFFGRKLINGYLPVSIFDFDARQILSYNNYEGFRLGVGGKTNERLFKTLRLDTYAAIGLKDNDWKFHMGASTRLDFFSGTWVGISYTNDLQEIASTQFLTDRKNFRLVDPRPFNITTFYNYKSWKGFVETKPFVKARSYIQLDISSIVPLFNYQFIHQGLERSEYSLTTATWATQWNPNSDFMQTPKGRVEIERRYPIITFQLTKTLNQWFGNEIDFQKIDIRAEYEKKYFNGHKTQLMFMAGWAIGDTPITHLYSTSPNNLSFDRVWQRVNFAGKSSFETMYFNEFFSELYSSFQFKHYWSRLRLSKAIQPQLVGVFRAAWGDLRNPEKHQGIAFKTLHDGYFESGIEFLKIYKGAGLTSFYRFGPNQLPRFEDNLAIKISYIFDLGF